MSIHSHARCDNCEKPLIPEEIEERIDEDAVLDAGWVVVSYVQNEEMKKMDFCSRRCLTVWAGVGSANNVPSS